VSNTYSVRPGSARASAGIPSAPSAITVRSPRARRLELPAGSWRGSRTEGPREMIDRPEGTRSAPSTMRTAAGRQAPWAPCPWPARCRLGMAGGGSPAPVPRSPRIPRQRGRRAQRPVPQAIALRSGESPGQAGTRPRAPRRAPPRARRSRHGPIIDVAERSHPDHPLLGGRPVHARNRWPVELGEHGNHVRSWPGCDGQTRHISADVLFGTGDIVSQSWRSGAVGALSGRWRPRGGRDRANRKG
jgi:hypothetical protein